MSRPLPRDSATAALPATPRRIALFGEFGIGNAGNDESCRRIVAFIRAVDPASEIAAIARSASGASQHLGLPAHSISGSDPSDHDERTSLVRRVADKIGEFGNLTRLVRRFDVVIVPGTGLIEQSSGRLPGGDLTWMLLLSLACRVRRVPLVWIAVGGGRFSTTLPRWAASLAARGAGMRSVRDEITARSLRRRASPDPRTPVVRDVVFARAEAASAQEVAPTARTTVGVAVIDYNPAPADGRSSEAGRRRYLAEMCEFVALVLERGHEVRFVMGDRADEFATRQVAELLGERLGATASAPAVPAFVDFETTLAAVSGCDVVVASRYHVLVAGALARRPLIAVSHADKDEALMGQLGVAEHLLLASDFDAAGALAGLDTALAASERIARTIDRAVRESHEIIARELERVRNHIWRGSMP